MTKTTTKVLIVDDSPVIRSQLEEVLGTEGFHLLIAADGKEAVEIFQEHGEDISLVFCDMRMPRLDGLGVLRWLNDSPLNGKIPFVMLTTEGSPEFIKEARKLGAVGWMVKPFNSTMLVNTAHRLTQKAKKAAAAAEATP